MTEKLKKPQKLWDHNIFKIINGLERNVTNKHGLVVCFMYSFILKSEILDKYIS